jgi:hypothetical protein
MDLLSSKKVLANLGYIVSRVPPATQTMTADQRDTKGWLVEFVGPSGIGKTTLHQQIAPAQKKDWFFEAHAKGLVGQVRANDTTEAYIRQLFVRRLENLQNININLETVAKISQRVCEVTRLGLVSKSMDVPRGFIMDDGLAHFFAEQILEQDTNATEAFLSKTAFVFLLPDEADTRPPTMPHTRTQLDVYHDLRDLMLSLGRPTLVLKRSEYNAEKVLSFIRHDVLNLEQGTSANPAN